MFGMTVKKMVLFLLFLFVFYLSAEDGEILSVQKIDFSAPDEKKDDKQIYLRSFYGGTINSEIGDIYAGTSLSFIPWKSLEITAGIGGSASFNKGLLVFSRVGWSFEFDFRKKASGVILRVPVAFGWRYISHTPTPWFFATIDKEETRAHSLNLSLGLELLVMFNKVFGITFHITVAADVVVAYRYHWVDVDERYNEDPLLPDVWSDVSPEKAFLYLDAGVINFVWRF